MQLKYVTRFLYGTTTYAFATSFMPLFANSLYCGNMYSEEHCYYYQTMCVAMIASIVEFCGLIQHSWMPLCTIETQANCEYSTCM